jgi:hypothetical protein
MIAKMITKSIMLCVLCVVWECEGMQGGSMPISYPPNYDSSYQQQVLNDNQAIVLASFNAFDKVGQKQIVANINQALSLAAMRNFSEQDVLFCKTVKNTVERNRELRNLSDFKGQYIITLDFNRENDAMTWTPKIQTAAEFAASRAQQSGFSSTFVNTKNYISPYLTNAKKSIAPHMSPGKIFLLTLVLYCAPVKNYLNFRGWLKASWMGIVGVGLVSMRGTKTPAEYVRKLWDVSLL